MPGKIRLTKAQMAKLRKMRLRRGFRSLRKARWGRPQKSLALKPHAFVERCNPQELTVANESVAVGLFRNFSLSQVLDVANYTRLFEYYKLNKVVVEFRYKGASTPAYASTPATTGGAQPAYNQEIINEINPVLYFKVDHNDSTADSLATLKKSMRTREKQLSNNNPNFTITLKPAVQTEAYKSAVTTTYIPKWGQWLSTQDDTVPHYGLKVYAVAGVGNSPNMGKIEVTSKIYFTCKNNE